MKKILFLAASLFALAACNKAADQPELVTYEITVDATQDAGLTKALALSGKTLNAVWNTSDVITVYNSSNTSLGTLKPQSAGSASAVLKGSITASGLSAGSTLTLLSPKASWLYSGQDGTFSKLSSNYSFARATVTVTSINGSTISTSQANFEPQQAIVKFTLVDGSNAPVNAEELEISTASGKLVRSFNSSMTALTGSISVEPADETNVIWVALRNDSGAADTYTLKATVGKKVYTAEKAGFKLENGSFYGITVKMAEETHDYTVAGSPASVFGTEWAPADTNNDMVRQSDGTYKKTYTLTAAKTDLSFKVVKDHSWDNGAYPSSNYTCSAGAGTLVITFDPSNNSVKATYPDPPADYKDIYTIAGDPASVFGTSWDVTNTANDMVLQSDGNYAKTYNSVPSGTELKFKVAVNHSWSLNYGADGIQDGADVYHKMSATKNLTISFNPTTHIISATEK